MNAPLTAPHAPAAIITVGFATQEGSGSVGVSVEITPDPAATCVTSCATSTPSPSPVSLPATGGAEPLSLLLPVALLLAGAAATVWSRRRSAARES